MNPEILMALAMLAACVSVYALGRALLPKGVRVRIQPVRRSAAREAALDVAHFSHATIAQDRAPAAKPEDEPGRTVLVAPSLTNLVPFSRSTNGYAFNFSQKNKNAFSRHRPTGRVR